MAFDGDRDKTIIAMVIARAWRDAQYKDQLLQEPKTVLADEGLVFPSDVEIKVLQETPTIKYVNLARETTDAKQALDVFQSVVPVPEGYEIRLVQSTERTRYVVLPTVPSGVEPAVASEAELNRLAAERTAVATTFVEFQTVGTTTTIFAEAEVSVVTFVT